MLQVWEMCTGIRFNALIFNFISDPTHVGWGGMRQWHLARVDLSLKGDLLESAVGVSIEKWVNFWI